MSQAKQTVKITNDLGVHLRAAGTLVQVAGRFEAEIWFETASGRANAKSIMSVLALAASKGVEATVSAEGADADQAVAAIVSLIESGFAE